MQVNGWVLGIGSALALVTIAQAQVRQPTIQLPSATGVEIAQLKAQLAEAKAAIANEQAERKYLEKMFLAHYHIYSTKTVQDKLDTPVCPTAGGGGLDCSKKAMPH